MATHTLYRRPVPWPFRALGWSLLAASLLVVVAFAAIVGSGGYYELTRTTDGEVRGVIERDLPARATTEQILLFLDAQGIEHGDVRLSDGQDTALLDAGVPVGTPIIIGRIRNDGYALQLRDVVVAFILDVEGLLDDYVVYEVGR
jgi:hypothetical protein